MQFARHYTLAEANAQIAWVRRIFGKVHQVSATLPPQFNLEAEPGKHAKTPAARKGGAAPAPTDMAKLSDDAAVDEACRNLSREDKMQLISGLLQGILDEGIVIQDVRRGLIDFPAVTREGEELLLCYELADGARIVAFHALEGGFAGRQPISELPQ